MEEMMNGTINQGEEPENMNQEAPTPAQDGAAQGATNPPAAQPEKKGVFAKIGGALVAAKDATVKYCTDHHVGTFIKGVGTGICASAVLLYTAAQVIAAQGNGESESTVVDASDFEVVDEPEETEATE